MNDTSMDGAATRDGLAGHIDELIAAGWIEYRLLALVEAAVGEDTPVLRAAAIQMLDVLRLEEMRPGSVLLDTAQVLLRQDRAGAGMRFQTWQACLSASRPHRGTMQDVCRDFPQWLDGVHEPHLAAWCDFLPALLEVHKRAAIPLVPDVKQDLNRFTEALEGAAYLEFWKRYLPAMLSDNLQALRGMGWCYHRPESPQIAARLEKVCPPEKAGEDDAAQEFLAAAGKAMNALPEEIRIPCLQLLLDIAGSALDSAVCVADRLPRALKTVDSAHQEAYVAMVTRLVRQVGIGSIGFSLGALQARLASGQAAAMQSFVDAVCNVAVRYGTQAAVDFMERRTHASQSLWAAPPGTA